MKNFKLFIEKSEEEENIQSMLKKLPKGHREMINGYKFRYQGGSVLKGDDQHIGLINKDKITVAAPWNYGREFTTLHEIGHLVWQEFMTDNLKKKWGRIVKNTKNKQDQNDEELFCMAYACHYAKHCVVIHDHPAWHKFIKEVPS